MFKLIMAVVLLTAGLITMHVHRNPGYTDLRNPPVYEFTPLSQPSGSSQNSQNDAGYRNTSGNTSTSNNSPASKELTTISFSKHSFTNNQRFYVRWAPSGSAVYSKTSGGGQVYASTNKEVYVAGKIGDWLLIRYKLSNSNQYRLGFTKDASGSFPILCLDNYPGTIISDCYFSDGVDSYRLKSGTRITVLGKIDSVIYIEAAINGNQAYGMVSGSSVDW